MTLAVYCGHKAANQPNKNETLNADPILLIINLVNADFHCPKCISYSVLMFSNYTQLVNNTLFLNV